MTGQLAALILLNTAFLIQTQEVPHPLPMTVVELGDTVTLTCSVSGHKLGLFYWYKLNFAYMIQTVAAGTFDKISLQGQFDNSRFRVTKAGDHYFLDIRNVSKEDEATYFCQTGSAYTMKISDGIMLAVNDKKNQAISVYVKQSPEAASVQPGDSLIIQCSLLTNNKDNEDQCSDEDSVYWFRSGSGGFNSSIIYIHKSSSNEQKKRSCVYSLSKTIQDSSDAGTYYCAVITCGEILFGEGTTVDTRQQLGPVVIILGILLAICVIVIAILIFSKD